MPARNEERGLERAIASHLASDYPHLEVIVVDDRSTDRTPEILERLSRSFPRLKVIRAAEPGPGWLGKPNALRAGAEEATGAWLLFADADVEYGPGTLRGAVSTAAAEDLGLLCVLPRIETRGFWEGVLMPNLAALLYLGPGFLFNSRRHPRLAIGAGSGNLVSRRALEETGGFEPLKDAVIDDVALARRVKRAGFRVEAFNASDHVQVRMYEGFREIAEGFTKNLAFLFRWPAAVVGLVLFFLLLAWAPYAVLAAGRGGAERAAAAFAIAATLAGRILVARSTRTPSWSAFFHPLMVTVWAGIAVRSLWRRIVVRRILWRGRSVTLPG